MAVYGNTVLREGLIFNKDDNENRVQEKLKNICKNRTNKKAILILNMYYDRTIYNNVINDLKQLFDYIIIGKMMRVTGDYGNYFYQSYYGIKNNVFYRFSIKFIQEQVIFGADVIFRCIDLNKLDYDKNIIFYIFKNFDIDTIDVNKKSINVTSSVQNPKNIYEQVEKYIKSTYKDEYKVSYNTFNIKISK